MIPAAIDVNQSIQSGMSMTHPDSITIGKSPRLRRIRISFQNFIEITYQQGVPLGMTQH